MPSIFSRIHWPLVYLLWRNIYSGTLSLFIWAVCCFCCWVVWVLYMFWILTRYQIYIFFHSVGGFFCCPEALYFDTGPLVYFWFCCSCFKGLFQGRCRYSSVPGILSMHVSLIWSCRWWKAAPLRWSFFPVCVFLGLGMEHGGLWALGRRAPHARTAQLPGLCLWKKFLKKQIGIE